MTNQDLMYLKAKLLCYGIKADRRTKAYMVQKNPYVLEKDFVHAAHFLIKNTVINTCIEERFCEGSPFSVILRNGKLDLIEDNRYVCEIDVLELPDWCGFSVKDYRIGDYLRPHSRSCISFWPYLQCDYYAHGKQCGFCSIGGYVENHNLPSPVLPLSVASKMVYQALLSNSKYELAVSGGTFHDPDRSVDYYSQICELARECGTTYISVETAPPTNLDCLKKLHECGATAIIMNLEIADESLRRIICPGKSHITQAHYFHAYEKAVTFFGPGNVSCVLIAGIQSVDNIVRMAEKLVSIGVIPTIIPFKPLDKCRLRDNPVTNPNDVITVALEIDKLLQKSGMSAELQGGCTRCNGCSLETVVAEI